MIHYHGTPIGGNRQDAVRFLAGRHALVPFPRQDDVGIVADTCKASSSTMERLAYGSEADSSTLTGTISGSMSGIAIPASTGR